MSHIRGNNGEVVRVLDFIDSMFDCDTSNGRGLYQAYPDELFRKFFFDRPKNYNPCKDDIIVDVVSSQYMQSQWRTRNYCEHKLLDLKIIDEGINYEINIPAGHVVEMF